MGLLDVDYEKLAGNPLLQMGLGILANNQGHYGNIGPALGLGMRQGLLNTQQFKNSQTELNQRQQGLDISKAYRDSEARLNEIQMKKLQDYQDAIDQAARENPQFGALLKVDPQGAFRALYPQAYQPLAQPYSSVEYDDQGNAYLFNHRETDPSKAMTPINVNGKNFVGGKMSPDLQGRIQGAKSENAAAWKPNNDFPGILSTDAEVSRAANNNGMPSNNFNMPFPVYFGAPGTTKTDRQEGITKDSDIQLLDPKNARPLPKGIKVPTPAEMAGNKKRAEVWAEKQTNAEYDMPRQQLNAQQTIDLVDKLISHPGFSSAVGLSSLIDPRNYIPGYDAKDFNIMFDQLKGKQFLEAYNTLKGGGQITEIEGKKATDALSRMNKASSEQAFIQAAKDFKQSIIDGYAKLNKQAGGNGQPLQAQKTAVRRGKYNGRNVIQYSDGSIDYAD